MRKAIEMVIGALLFGALGVMLMVFMIGGNI
jgi:hypothetical protein